MSLIDWSRVNELHDEIGSEDFDEVVEMFLEEVDAVIDRLKTCAARDALEEDLHFLKGSALSLGFRAFSTLCEIGEQRSAAGKAASVNLTEIIDVYERSKQEFVAQLPSKLAA